MVPPAMIIPRCFVFAFLLLALTGCRAQQLITADEPRHYTPADLSVFAGVPRPPEWQSMKDTAVRQAIQQTLQGSRAVWMRGHFPRLVTLEEAFARITDRFQIPVQGRLSSPFGYRMHPILHRLALHTGVDISVQEQVRIAAVGAGQITFADLSGGDGLKIVIDHGAGISTVYAHASQIMVRVGMQVYAGQIIALVGHTGLATGPHLHLEIRLNNRPKDPLFFMPGLRRLGWEAKNYSP